MKKTQVAAAQLPKNWPSVIKALTLLATISLVASPSLARWAPIQNANYAIESESDSYSMSKNGKIVSRYDVVIELLNDEARNEFGLYRLPYDSNSCKMKIIEATVTNRTEKSVKVTHVKKSDIEDKPLASSGPGFDQTNQVTIPFPDLKTGSKIHLIYEATDKAVVPGYFGLWFPIGHNEYVKSWKFKVHSEIPLYTDIRDPGQNLKVTASTHDVSIELTKPIYQAVIEEENGLEDLPAYTWVGVSSLQNWSDLSKKLIQRYESEIAGPLPTAFQRIAEKAALGKTAVDQINMVTSLLQDQVRYVGDWRRVDGGYYPRPLQEISDSSYGDCKDFATSTNAILRHMGFETHPAMIRRERFLASLPSKIPILDFNHAISFIKKDGHEFWVDPTNVSSNAQGLYNDIENRPAVILYTEGAKLAHTPALTVGAGTSKILDQVKLGADQTLSSEDHLEWLGQSSVFLTAWGLTYTKPNLDNTLLKWVADPSKVRSVKFEPYDLSSRIVHDTSVDFHVEQSWQPIITTRGTGMSIPMLAQVLYFAFEPDQRVSGLKLEDPYTWIRNVRIGGREIDMRGDLQKKLSCNGDTPWIRFARKFEKDSSDILIHDEVTLKESSIPVIELKTLEFKAMQKSLSSCMGDAIVILK